MMVLAGGVSANTKLKDKIQKISNRIDILFISPKKNMYSMDYAAMV